MIMGIGLRRDAIPDLAIPDGVTALATIAPRAAALAHYGLPVHAIPPEALRGVATPTISPRILALYGCGSVAEAAALIAAGPDAEIVMPRQVSGHVTWALARKGSQ